MATHRQTVVYATIHFLCTQVVMAIEEEFALEIPDNEADKILSIDDAVKYITAHPQAK